MSIPNFRYYSFRYLHHDRTIREGKYLLWEMSHHLTVAPLLQPVLGNASEAIGTGSRAVIDQDDQYEVFNNARADDPSHSMLSKV